VKFVIGVGENVCHRHFLVYFFNKLKKSNQTLLVYKYTHMEPLILLKVYTEEEKSLRPQGQSNPFIIFCTIHFSGL